MRSDLTSFSFPKEAVRLRHTPTGQHPGQLSGSWTAFLEALPTPIPYTCCEIPSCPPEPYRENPAFRLMSSKPRGNVHMATDMAH